MSPGMKRSVVVMASLTLAATAFSSAALAQDPSASPAPAESAAPSTGGPNLFNTTYPDRFVAGTPGGTVLVADWQEANLFNPYYYNQVTEADVATATQGGLITSTDDFKYAPDQAVSIPTTDNGGVVVADDGSVTITWKLRDGLAFSDGTPLTCEDFKFTAGWILDPANVGMPAGKAGYLTDAGLAYYGEKGEVRPKDINLTVECPSATDMVWTLKEPYEGYLTLIPVALPKHYMESIPIADALTGKGYLADELPNTPVSGPFKYESVTPGQELRLVRNDFYKDALTGGPAYLDGVVFKWYGDADAMIAAYQGAQPEYDVAKDLNDADIPKLEGLQEVLAFNSLTYEFLRPNWSKKECSITMQPARGGNCVMNDPAMREALKYAIDKDAINARLLGGNAAIAYTNTSPNAWFYVPPAEVPTQDLDKASAALAAAGWVPDPNSGFLFKDVDGDGVKDYSKGDYDARIEACTTTRQVRQDTLAMVSGYLNQIGVSVIIAPVSSADIFASYNESTEQTPCALSRANFDLAEHAYSVPLDPNSNFGVYHSSQFDPQGQNNARVKDKDVDTALMTVKNTVDFNVVLDAMATFQKVYIDKTIEVPLYFRKEVYLKNPTLHNFTGNPTSTGPMWNVQHWYFGE
jgi:peptide/nickel transport system substrate-binding protein